MSYARPVVLEQKQRLILEQQARARSLEARVVERSRIVLLASEGKPDMEIGSELGISPKKAARWRNRFLDLGWKGLEKKDLYLICDNYATHKHPQVQRWLSRHKRFHVPLHAYKRLVAEHGGTFLPGPYAKSVKTWHLPRPGRTHHGRRRLP
jgi:hypothetical protein